jgi:hypothetical protein
MEFRELHLLCRDWNIVRESPIAEQINFEGGQGTV